MSWEEYFTRVTIKLKEFIYHISARSQWDQCFWNHKYDIHTRIWGLRISRVDWVIVNDFSWLTSSDHQSMHYPDQWRSTGWLKLKSTLLMCRGWSQKILFYKLFCNIMSACADAWIQIFSCMSFSLVIVSKMQSYKIDL